MAPQIIDEVLQAAYREWRKKGDNVKVGIAALILMVSSLSYSVTLKNLEDQNDLMVGIRTIMICGEADAKSDALKILSTADLSACGLGAADTVYRAVQALALDENVNQNGFAYEYVKTDSINCNGNSAAGQNLAKQVQTESIENCLALGHSSCVGGQPKFVYTTDGYCVASCEAEKASNSTMTEVGKLLVAKSLLANALNLYHVIPCDSAKAGSLIQQAEGLLRSANIDPNPYGMCPFNR